jgi:hypothetical protein
MSYKNIAFLSVGKQAIKNEYRNWFKTDSNFQYESGDVELYYQGTNHNLPNGNARRWDYIILKLENGILIRVVFAEPHPIKENQVKEVLKKLEWLKYTIQQHADLRHFKSQKNEFYWIYSNSKISKNSQSRRMCDKMGLKIVGIPLDI